MFYASRCLLELYGKDPTTYEVQVGSMLVAQAIFDLRDWIAAHAKKA